MAYTSDDLTAIQTAIAKGEKTVQFADRAVTYRSISELLEAEKRISGALGARPRQSLGYSEKGF